jgi:hypothetical protein
VALSAKERTAMAAAQNNRALHQQSLRGSIAFVRGLLPPSGRKAARPTVTPLACGRWCDWRCRRRCVTRRPRCVTPRSAGEARRLVHRPHREWGLAKETTWCGIRHY